MKMSNGELKSLFYITKALSLSIYVIRFVTEQFNIIDKIPSTAKIVDVNTRQIWTDAALTKEIGTRCEKFLAWGAASNSHVILSNENSTEMLLNILAVWSLGATAVPISSTYKTNEIDHQADALAPSLILIDGKVYTNSPSTHPAKKRLISNASIDQSILLVLVTSGTSGTPKRVAISEAAFLNRMNLNISNIGTSTLSKTLVLLPLHFGHGLIGNTLTALFAGGTVYLGATKDIDGISKLGSLIDELEITFLSSVPSLWRMALKLSPPPKTDCLQRIHFGSEPVSSDLWRAIDKWGGAAETFNMYGMTETSNWISGTSGKEADFVTGSVGQPWGGQFALLLDNGTISTTPEPDELGEILIKSPSVMTGYLGNEKDTQNTFRDGWFLTGDLGKLDAKGQLRIVGRLKNQINCAGIKVSIEEVDQLLERHPDVSEACSFAAPDPISGEVVAAAVVLNKETELSAATLQSWCRNQIHKEAVPALIWIVHSLAKTSRGKLDRKSVQEQMLNQVET